MSLKQRITDDMKAAMRAKDTARLGAIRLLLAAMKQREVDGRARRCEASGAGMPSSASSRTEGLRPTVSEADERTELSDADIVAIIEKMNKQRRDSISQYESAGRQELADAEKFEMSVLAAYLPRQMSEAEIDAAIAEAMAATGAAGPQDMGKVMGILKPKLAGRADMGKVSALIKAQLPK